MKKKDLLTKLFILALIVGACALAYQYLKREGFEGEVPDLSNFTGMVVFTKKECPYCKAMEDVNAKLLAKYADKFKVIDTEGDDQPMLDLKTKYKVDGVPKIVLLKSGQPSDYAGDRTEASMSEAIESL